MAAQYDKSAVWRLMRILAPQHFDAWGEINATTLAESVAHHYQQPQWLDDPKHFVLELALRVHDQWRVTLAADLPLTDPSPVAARSETR